MTDQRADRATAALYGLAIGDALGMPTQLMSHREVQERFGSLTGFRAAPDGHPIAHGLAAGSITDDTEQAILLAEALIAGGGHVDAAAFAASLIDWENRMRERGSLDLLGPSTKAAIAALQAGASPSEAGKRGTTNGAAMRITPVGIVMPSHDLGALVDRVEDVSRLTHNTGIAISGAAAVATAVSAGIDGKDFAEATRLATLAAQLGESRGNWVAGASVAARIELAISLADPTDPEASLRRLRERIGTSLATQEAVPLAFGVLAVHPDDPWEACCAAAAQGGDSDTIAAMAGAIAGACHGTTGFPAHASDTIRSVNSLNLDDLATRLLALRP